MHEPCTPLNACMHKQDIVIIGLIMKHLKISVAVMAASAAAFAALCVWLYGGGASIEVLAALQVRGVGPGGLERALWMVQMQGASPT